MWSIKAYFSMTYPDNTAQFLIHYFHEMEQWLQHPLIFRISLYFGVVFSIRLCFYYKQIFEDTHTHLLSWSSRIKSTFNLSKDTCVVNNSSYPTDGM